MAEFYLGGTVVPPGLGGCDPADGPGIMVLFTGHGAPRAAGRPGRRRNEEEAVTTISTSVNIGKKPAPVTLSDDAATKVAELLAQEEGSETLALRVAVKPGGCSGYSYEMFFDSEVMADDVVREFGTIKVVVDPASADLLTGSTLDYSDGLQGAGFHITNPNATRTCGCGSSFS
jgi:iron-sulfur cluster assembly protein/iron-sulfur cluster insertion protein